MLLTGEIVSCTGSAHPDLDAAVDQLLEIAGVTPDKRARPHYLITKFMLQDAADSRIDDQIFNDPEYERKRKAVVAEWYASFIRVTKAFDATFKAMHELKTAITAFEQSFGVLERRHQVAPSAIYKSIDDFLAWENCQAPMIVEVLAKEPQRRRGRPPGSRAGWHLFICFLIFTVEEAGGKLKFDKNYPDRGSLIKSLNLLRAHLSHLPDPVPIRAIQAARALHRAGRDSFERECERAAGDYDSPLERIIERKFGFVTGTNNASTAQRS